MNGQQLSSSAAWLDTAISEPAAMEVHVVYTGVGPTLSALRTAAQLASGLTARIRLLMLEVVPYPLPLEQPPRNLQFVSRRFRTLAASPWQERDPKRRQWIDTRVDIVLCRDAWQGLAGTLAPGSVVVIGCRASFWPFWASREERLARKLRDAGHHVVRARASSNEA